MRILAKRATKKTDRATAGNTATRSDPATNQPEVAQPPTALDQVGWMAKLPVGRLSAVRFIHAHRSPFSSPSEATQPLEGSGSVTASAYSWPPTMLNPSNWFRTELAPQLEPASSTYGMFVKATLPFQLCQAQKPVFG